ncbi:FAD-binding protein [Legionella sp. W05-934-2]|jgi:FAD/FMN-containing dehydrogenase|uniref:FAD-binding oxidoreductase n=1 Tax=Legionella sp. W05-934-2 TaxID=1198649 RepID=UPI003462C016
MTERIGASWGRPAPNQQSMTYLVDRFQASELIQRQKKPILPYGFGSSYGDVCLNQSGTLISCQWLDKLIEFDNQKGKLRCEAGVTVGEIQQFAMAHGWCLAVSPGSQWISVGGAIANDVHGKNHHRQGTFGCHVIDLKLVRSDGTTLDCSQEENADMFAATIGGLGLTGIIIESTLQLIPCRSYYLSQEKIPFKSLAHFFELADSSEKDWDYTVAWLDCVTRKAGRGVFMRANFLREMRPLKLKSAFDLPYPFKGNLINRPVNRFMAAAIFNKNRFNQQSVKDYVSFFYPLDRLKHWSKFYGHQGMYQFQCVIPYGNRLAGLQQLLDKIKSSGLGGFISVLKTFSAKSSPGLLSFPMHGVTLAVDFAANEKERNLLVNLTQQVVDMGGRIYTAKDALMPAACFQLSYPGLKKFQAFRDPGICSNFSNRVMDEV